MHIHLSEFLKNCINVKEERDIRTLMMPERTFDKYLEIHNIDDNDINEHTFEKYLLESCFQSEYDYERFQNYQRNIYINEYINETVSESWNYTRLIDKIKDKFDIYDLRTDRYWIDHNNVTAFSFYCDKDIRNDNRLMHTLDLFNYYIMKAEKTNGEWFFKIDPRKPKEVTNKIYNENHGILYHVCSNDQYQKAKIKGLNPRNIKTKNERRPYRRYFVSNKNPDECYKSLLMLKAFMQKDYNKVVVIKIDLNKFKHKLKFYPDTTGQGFSSYFTLDYIPAICISEIDINDLKRNDLTH